MVQLALAMNALLDTVQQLVVQIGNTCPDAENAENPENGVVSVMACSRTRKGVLLMGAILMTAMLWKRGKGVMDLSPVMLLRCNTAPNMHTCTASLHFESSKFGGL